MINNECPTHLVNCIGVTKFNNSYHIKNQTKYINTIFPRKLAKFCFQKKIYFIHISTDCVFSGKKGTIQKHQKKTRKIYMENLKLWVKSKINIVQL